MVVLDRLAYCANMRNLDPHVASGRVKFIKGDVTNADLVCCITLRLLFHTRTNDARNHARAHTHARARTHTHTHIHAHAQTHTKHTNTHTNTHKLPPPTPTTTTHALIHPPTPPATVTHSSS